jgi:hypothetical protein
MWLFLAVFGDGESIAAPSFCMWIIFLDGLFGVA